MAEPTIATGFANAFLEFAVARGADRQTLIEQSRLHPQDTGVLRRGRVLAGLQTLDWLEPAHDKEPSTDYADCTDSRALRRAVDP